jgi:hypothetical protein
MLNWRGAGAAPLWALAGASQGRYRPGESRQQVIHPGRGEHGWQRREPPMTRAGDRGPQTAGRVASDSAKAQVAPQGAGDDPDAARAADLIGALREPPQVQGGHRARAEASSTVAHNCG